MPKPVKFSLAVTGRGLLMDPLIVDLTNRFPHATIFDRSDATNEARGVEADLGKKGYLRPQDRAWARRVRRDLTAPPATDLVVDFRTPRRGGPTHVTVSRRGVLKRLTFRRPKSITELDADVRGIINAIVSLL